MNWIVLFIAGVFEVAMTFCLGKTKGAQGAELYLWIGGFVLATVLSMGLLAKAVQMLPIGTANRRVSPGFFSSLPCSVLSSD